MKHVGKKILSLILVFYFILGFVPSAEKTIQAEEPVEYLDYNYETKSFDEKICNNYKLVGTGENTWRSGWYVVNQNLTNGNRIKVEGTVNLILCNNCTFDSRNGINVPEGNTLNIYAQTEDKRSVGNLTVVGMNKVAGIGGDADESCGVVVINGGMITTKGGKNAASIGGGSYGNGGNVVINGGIVHTDSGEYGAGIGGGYLGDGGSVIINAGEVNTSGFYGAGIGGGFSSKGGNLVVNGGVIVSNGYYFGAGIGGSNYGSGGSVTINNGIVIASGGQDGGSGIGGGTAGDGGIVEINGGSVTATGGDGAAGIGGGYYDFDSEYECGAGGTVKINGGVVVATGGGGATGIGHVKNSNDDGLMEIASGVSVYGDDNINPPTTLIKTGPALNVDTRKRYMKTEYALSPIAPIIETQPTQSGTIVYGNLNNRNITGAILSNKEKLETVSYQWYENTTASNKDGTAIEEATQVDYEIPINRKVGVYHYYCVIKNTIKDGRSTEVATEPITIEIKKAKPIYVVPHFTTRLGKTLKDLDLPKLENGSFSWVEDINTSVGDIGDNIFHVNFTPDDTKNYEVLENIEVIVTVTEKTPQMLEFEKDIISKTYGDETFSQLVSGAATEVTYSVDNVDVANINVSSGAVTIKGVGKATITANAKETDEYAVAKAEYVLEVNAKRINVKADNKSSKIGENLVELTYTSDTLMPGDKFTGTLETYADKNKAGTYKINQGTLTPGDNYEIEFTPGVYTVIPVPTPQPSPNPSSGGGVTSWNVMTPSTSTETTGDKEINASQNTNSINKKTLKDITLPYELKTRKYINGYEDKTFKPDQDITRAEVTQVIYKLINKGESINYDVLARFSDVETGKWYSKAIAYLAEKNIINGSDGKYNPDNSITRAETAQILFNILKSYDTGEKNYTYGANPYDFSDISGWYSETIKQLVSNGMVNGYADKTFRPNDRIKRAEFVTMIAKVFSRNIENTSITTNFTDVSSDYWAMKYINDAAE